MEQLVGLEWRCSGVKGMDTVTVVSQTAEFLHRGQNFYIGGGRLILPTQCLHSSGSIRSSKEEVSSER